SSKKGHKYVTLGVDLDESRVIFVTEGKGKATLHNLQEHLENKGVEKEQIEQISRDLSPSFIDGAAEAFPSAEITFDRFHVVKLLNEAMNQVRTGAPCYLTKFRDSCRHNSFTYAADGRCPERPASATTTHKSRFVITTSLAGRLFGMQFLLLSRAASTRRISELPCRLSGTKNHHFAKLRFHDF
ncbi:transposase, partial [Bathymodiolus platifrons methanotrophic gill symbiont]|uniref:transposase n=1 Tax=Bathymodiolus platifrons methanotrophic gill symbiont TaxID=113268 RepID=UPI003B845ED0